MCVVSFQVIEGLLQAHPSVITSRDHCCQLLGHEASRVLHDRLTNDADRRYFYTVLSDQLRSGFKARWGPEELEKTPLIFGDFLEAGATQGGPRAYRFVRQYERLPQILEVSFARFDFLSPPLSAPGSPRMGSLNPGQNYSQFTSHMTSISDNKMNIRIRLLNVRHLNEILKISLEIFSKKSYITNSSQ